MLVDIYSVALIVSPPKRKLLSQHSCFWWQPWVELVEYSVRSGNRITRVLCKTWKHRRDRPWTARSWTCSTTHCLWWEAIQTPMALSSCNTILYQYLHNSLKTGTSPKSCYSRKCHPAIPRMDACFPNLTKYFVQPLKELQILLIFIICFPFLQRQLCFNPSHLASSLS